MSSTSLFTVLLGFTLVVFDMKLCKGTDGYVTLLLVLYLVAHPQFELQVTYLSFSRLNGIHFAICRGIYLTCLNCRC